MDGGAYWTLTPVVLSRGTLHAGGPYRCPNVRIRGARDRHQHAAERRVPRLRRAADRVRRRDAGLSRRRSPRHVARSRSAARNGYRLGDATPTGQVLRARASPAKRCSTGQPRPRVRAVRDEPRVSSAAPRSGRRGWALPHRRTQRARASASRWPGTARASPAAARSTWPASPPRADGRRPDPDPDGVDRDGPGHEDDLPAARRRRSWACRRTRVDIAPQDTALVPDSGPTVASRTAMVVGGLRHRGRAPAQAEVEERDRRALRRGVPGRRPATTADPRRPAFEPYPGVDSTTPPTRGDAYPAFGWAAAVAEVDVDLDTGEVTSGTSSPPTTSARHPPRPGRGSGRGRHAAGRWLRHDRGDQARRRALPERPARDVPHPDGAGRAAHRHDPRRGALQRRAAWREGRR